MILHLFVLPLKESAHSEGPTQGTSMMIPSHISTRVPRAILEEASIPSLDNAFTDFPDSDDSDDATSKLSGPRSKRRFVSDEEAEVSLGKSSPPSSVALEVPESKRLKVVKTEDDSVPPPDSFPLPKHYPHDIQSALQTKKMSVTDKQRFISKITSAMLRYKKYPTHDNYFCVAKTVLNKYPFLKTSDRKPYVSTLDVIIIRELKVDV